MAQGDNAGDAVDNGAAAAASAAAGSTQRGKESALKLYAARWLARNKPNLLGIFQLIKKSLLPLSNLLSNYIAVSGETWERKQQLAQLRATASQHRGEPAPAGRDFHALLAARNEYELQCVREVDDLMHNAEQWSTFPAASRLESFSVRAFCMLSSSACQCHELVTSHEGYPWKLFRLLLGINPALEEEILNDCHMLFDPWSLSIVDAYRDRPLKLQDPSCIAELINACHLLRRETAQIEAGHASIRRALKINSVQTHGVLFTHMSAQRTTQHVRKVAAATKRAAGTAGEAACSASERKRGSGSQCVEQREQRKRTCYGGAWRAFIRTQTLGQRSSPDIAVLATKYWELSADERAHYAEMGRLGVEARRAGAATTFGESSRTMRARQRRMHRRVMLQALAFEQQQREQVPTQVVEVVHRPAETGILSPVAGRSVLWERLSELKDVLRLEAGASLMREVWAGEEHGRLQREANELELESLAGSSMTLRIRSPEFSACAIGETGVTVLEWSPSRVHERVRRSLSLPVKGYRSQLMRLLLEQWVDWHATVDSEPWPDEDEPNEASMPLCKQAGFCLCGAPGIQLQSFTRLLELRMKAACPPGPLRVALSHAEMALVLIGQARPECDHLDSAAAWADGIMPGADVVAVRWLHIGNHSLNPWRATYHDTTGPACGDVAVGLPDEVALVAQRCRLTKWQLVKELDFDLRWVCGIYRSVFRIRPLAEFLPKTFHGKRLFDPPRLVWCNWCARPRKKSSKRAKGMSNWGAIANIPSAEPPIQANEDEPEYDPDDESEVGQADATEDASACDDSEFASGEGSEGAAEEAQPDDLLVDYHDDGVSSAASDQQDVYDAIGELVELPEPGLPAGSGAPADPPAPPPLGPPLGAPHMPSIPGLSVSCKFGSGKVTYYPLEEDFVAQCFCPRHNQPGEPACRVRRTKAGRSAGRRRPCGFLAAWLLQGDRFESGRAHKFGCEPTLEETEAFGVIVFSQSHSTKHRKHTHPQNKTWKKRNLKPIPPKF